LVIEGPAGNEMVNFRVKGTTFVVDRLFVKAALLLGVGKTPGVGGDRAQGCAHIAYGGEVMADENKVDGNAREEVVLSPEGRGRQPNAQ